MRIPAISPPFRCILPPRSYYERDIAAPATQIESRTEGMAIVGSQKITKRTHFPLSYNKDIMGVIDHRPALPGLARGFRACDPAAVGQVPVKHFGPQEPDLIPEINMRSAAAKMSKRTHFPLCHNTRGVHGCPPNGWFPFCRVLPCASRGVTQHHSMCAADVPVCPCLDVTFSEKFSNPPIGWAFDAV